MLPGVTAFASDTGDEGREIERQTQLADHDGIVSALA